MTFRSELEGAARASGVALDARVLDACAEHFALLLKWNRTHNLTRVTDPAEAARKHYLDCLVPLLALRDGAALADDGGGAQQAPVVPASFVDVGSGAGFPGLLAALVWPEATATLVEPAQKRASFLTLAARAMGVTVVVRDPPPAAKELHGLASAAALGGSPAGAASVDPGAPARPAFSAHPALVLSRATFSPGARRGLLESAGEAIGVWGHPADVITWKAEVATWSGWRPMWQPYRVDALEDRAVLWGVAGVFHVERPPAAG